jgi:hypothetical protein
MKIAIVLTIVLLSAFTAVRLVTAFVRDQRAARYRAERQLVAIEIERWASPQATRSSWDALLEGPFPDPDFERFRQRLLALRKQYPPHDPEAWCGEAAWPSLRELAAELRAV